MHPELERIAANLAGCLIAVDFDGTLSPIVDDPAQARAVPGAVPALSALANAGAQIAVVTGRDVATVLRLGRLDEIQGLVISGVHGAETWRDGQLRTRSEPDGFAKLRADLLALLQGADEGVWLEDKRLSLVVHTRTAADPEASLEALRAPVTDLAQGGGLEVVPGKAVLEIRIPNLSKADALDTLLTASTTAALFGGDDLGDLPAFQALRRWNQTTGKPIVAIAVGDIAEVVRAADVRLNSPAEFAELLSELAGR
jgi:trehalose 6-phosphate phosphatase